MSTKNIKSTVKTPLIIKSPIGIIPVGELGFKEAQNRFHAYGRIIAICILFGIIAYSIYSEHLETTALEDLNSVVKKDTILYNSILELDECYQQKYLNSLKRTFEKDSPTLFNKYSKSIQIALLAGIFSEYIVNGNASKPLGIVGKTSIYTALITMLS